MKKVPIFRLLALTLLAIIYLTPVGFMVVASFKPDHRVLADSGSILALVPVEASWQNYLDVFNRVNFGRYLFNSLLITSAIVFLGLWVNSLAGYALARLRFPGRELILSLVLALLVIPFESIAVPLFAQVTWMGWRDSYHVQILPFMADAFSIYLFYTFFIGLPRELEEAAKMDGASTWRIYWSIIIPNSLPVFATVAVLTFLMRWGTYLWPLLVTVGETYRPLPVALAAFENQVKFWGDIMAFGVLMVLPILVVFLCFQNWLVKGVAAGRPKF